MPPPIFPNISNWFINLVTITKQMKQCHNGNRLNFTSKTIGRFLDRRKLRAVFTQKRSGGKCFICDRHRFVAHLRFQVAWKSFSKCKRRIRDTSIQSASKASSFSTSKTNLSKSMSGEVSESAMGSGIFSNNEKDFYYLRYFVTQISIIPDSDEYFLDVFNRAVIEASFYPS